MRLQKRINRFWSRVSKSDGSGCWLWTGGRNGNGYGVFCRTGSHRFSWELANGLIPEGFIVCHRCDTPLCVNPSHLFLGTTADNVRDRDEKRRRHENRIKGERHPGSKLSEEVVRCIRLSGDSNAALGRRFGVNASTVSRVRHRVFWDHVQSSSACL